MGSRRVLRRLMREGNTDLPVLRAMLGSGENRVWLYAAERLCDLGPEAAEAVEDLVRFVRAPRRPARGEPRHEAVIASMKALARIAPRDDRVLSTLRDIATLDEASRKDAPSANQVVHVRWVAWVQLELLGETQGMSSPSIQPASLPAHLPAPAGDSRRCQAWR